jgi:hypothetical protein
MLTADTTPRRPSVAQMAVRSLSIHRTILKETAAGTIATYANGIRSLGDVRGYLRAHTLRKWGALSTVDGSITDVGRRLLEILNARAAKPEGK